MHIHVWSITYCCYYKRQQFVAEFSVIRVHLLLLHHYQISLKHGYKPTKKAGIAKMAAKPVAAANKVSMICV